MHPLQEKFQVIVPCKEEDGEQWATFESARDVRVSGVPGILNAMPPGMDVANQTLSEQRQQPLSIGGATDVSKDASSAAMLQGFTKRSMRGTDDCYTGEHVDHFYGDAGGFAERNNYLDRI